MLSGRRHNQFVDWIAERGPKTRRVYRDVAGDIVLQNAVPKKPRAYCGSGFVKPHVAMPL